MDILPIFVESTKYMVFTAGQVTPYSQIQIPPLPSLIVRLIDLGKNSYHVKGTRARVWIWAHIALKVAFKNLHTRHQNIFSVFLLLYKVVTIYYTQSLGVIAHIFCTVHGLCGIQNAPYHLNPLPTRKFFFLVYYLNPALQSRSRFWEFVRLNFLKLWFGVEISKMLIFWSWATVTLLLLPLYLRNGK